MSRGGRVAVVVSLVGSGMCLRAGVLIETASATLQAVPRESPSPPPAAVEPPFVVPTGPDAWFRPWGRNVGTEGLANALADLALHGNAPLAITSGWGRTTGADASDHHVSQLGSWAIDLAVPGVGSPSTPTATAAARIASALGEPGWTDGNLVKTIGGYRFQLLWLVAGHFDHVHLGVRRVG